MTVNFSGSNFFHPKYVSYNEMKDLLYKTNDIAFEASYRTIRSQESYIFSHGAGWGGYPDFVTEDPCGIIAYPQESLLKNQPDLKEKVDLVLKKIDQHLKKYADQKAKEFNVKVDDIFVHFDDTENIFNGPKSLMERAKKHFDMKG